MPTPRRPLGPITPNVVKKKDLSLHSRGKIIRVYIAGTRPAVISRLFFTPDSTVRTIILKEDLQPYRLSMPKPGRLIEYSVQDKRSILRFIRLYLKTKYSIIKEQYSLKILYLTIKYIL